MNISQKRLDKGLYWERAWTLVNGCTKVSEGCENCWAERLHIQFKGSDSIDWKGNIKLCEGNLDLPLRIKKPTVFAIWNDLFHEKVPFEFIEKVFKLIQDIPRHTFLVLTKRLNRIVEFISYWKYNNECIGSHYLNFPDNLWLGITVENQNRMKIQIEKYLCKVSPMLFSNYNTFISIEPMLGEISQKDWILTGRKKPETENFDCLKKINWVIVGAESGAKRRPCNIEWVRNIKDQCQKADVPLFIKQIHIDGKLVKDINKFPEDLRYREMPK